MVLIHIAVSVYRDYYVCVFRVNNVEDHVVNQNSGMNVDELRSVTGKELFKNSQYLVQIHTHTHTLRCVI